MRGKRRNKMEKIIAMFRLTDTSKCKMSLHLFFFLLAVLEELVNAGRLKGTVVGGKQDKAVFVPDIYARTQSNWVDSFFKQNGYLGN